jgi:hypothetical protein
VLGATQLIETVYQLVSRNDPETLRFLDDLIILAVHANPDGMELVSNWYMREPCPTQRSTAGVPRLYQKYVGHDNNRDFYLSAQPESTNMNRVLYHEWVPQIMYNHHQTGPAGTVMFAPPFRDPFNYNFDPLIPSQLDLVGAAMHSRFAAEGKPGVTTRRGANYSTWWNGGLRTTVYFHNMIGLLTETIGSPNPMSIPFLPDRQLPDSNLFFPIEPQVWHFRQSVDYSVTANYAVFDIASRNRENFLYNIYQMGKNSIARGSSDSWTPTPRRIIAAQAALVGEGRDVPAGGGGRGGRGGGPRRVPDAAAITRGPRSARLHHPADQPDFPTATKFVNALIKTGVAVHRATARSRWRQELPGRLVGREERAGVPPARARHVRAAGSSRRHPVSRRAADAPYDSAGWTLAFQMGVQFDRILDGFDGPFEKVEGLQRPPAGTVAVRAPRSCSAGRQRRVHRRQPPAGREAGGAPRRQWRFYSSPVNPDRALAPEDRRRARRLVRGGSGRRRRRPTP